MISRKGDAMWWIIIGAVLALVVLIVLIVLFTGKTNDLNKGISSCSGICTASGEKTCPVGTQSTSAFTCSTSGTCCIGFAKECVGSDDCKDDGECRVVDKKNYCVPRNS